MIALPDFAAGAMENWGLVTYRERLLLYDEKLYEPQQKLSVALVVAHELSHQVSTVQKEHSYLIVSLLSVLTIPLQVPCSQLYYI